MKVINWIVAILVIVGAINWGLIGLLGFDLVTTILGEGTMLTTLVYDLVGLSGVYALFLMLPKMTK